jgi:hypothetical protein
MFTRLSLLLSLSLSHTHISGVEISGLFYSFIPGMEHRVPRGYKTKLNALLEMGGWSCPLNL